MLTSCENYTLQQRLLTWKKEKLENNEKLKTTEKTNEPKNKNETKMKKKKKKKLENFKICATHGPPLERKGKARRGRNGRRVPGDDMWSCTWFCV